MFKKIYLEITNACNLSCPFCAQNKRPLKFLTEQEFKAILTKLKPYTHYLYFHVLGEPLLHPKINEFINLAHQDFQINITTNGYLIKKIKEQKNIRQLNISLHSFHEMYQKSLDDYINDIFESIELLKETTYISLRIWVKNQYTPKIIEKINQHFHTQINPDHIQNETHLAPHIFLNTHEEFIWPEKEQGKNYTGSCRALKDHLGILSDGTVVPCCLDSSGCINLGNIYKSSLKEIMNTPKYLKLKTELQNQKRTEKLCQNCNFQKEKQ